MLLTRLLSYFRQFRNARTIFCSVRPAVWERYISMCRWSLGWKCTTAIDMHK
jgi:hypothetical protein